MGRYSLCPFPICHLFHPNLLLTLPSSCKEAWNGTRSPGGRSGEAGAGQPRLGGLRAFRVKAGYGCQPWVHGPERQARHSAWESGQTGAEWEQRQERAGTDSSGKENGIHCQRLICLASGPEVCGWIGLLEAWVTGDKQPPFPTVPVAKSSWTLSRSHSLPWCIYFLILPNGKAVFCVLFFFKSNNESNFVGLVILKASHMHTHACIYTRVYITLHIYICIFKAASLRIRSNDL